MPSIRCTGTCCTTRRRFERIVWSTFAFSIFLHSCGKIPARDPNPPRTPLIQAIIERNPSEVERLLDSGADPNQALPEGFDSTNVSTTALVESPLTWAVDEKVAYDTVILQLLLSHGADPNRREQRWLMTNFLPLHEAVREGRIRTVAFLLRHGADPNRQDICTPLSEAILVRHVRILQSDEGAAFKDTSLAHRDSVYDTIITSLLASGASVTIPDVMGHCTPLHTAASFCDSLWTERFLALGADISAKDNKGKTAEDYARECGCTTTLDLLEKKH